MSTVDAYIERQPPEVRPALRRVRKAIRGAIPDAEEGISYGMPTYRQNGKAVVYFAGWATHCAIYPATAAVKTALGRLEPPLEFEHSTLRLPFAVAVPDELVVRVATIRAREAAGAKPPPRRQTSKEKRVTSPAAPGRQNAAWHASHRLQRGAPLAERVRWHVAHARACGCRPMPASVRAALGHR